MASDALKTSIGDRNVLVQSHDTVIWLEVENHPDSGHGITTIALTPSEAQHLALSLQSQALVTETIIELQAAGLTG